VRTVTLAAIQNHVGDKPAGSGVGGGSAGAGWTNLSLITSALELGAGTPFEPGLGPGLAAGTPLGLDSAAADGCVPAAALESGAAFMGSPGACAHTAPALATTRPPNHNSQHADLIREATIWSISKCADLG
jgi:hypothetical protein